MVSFLVSSPSLTSFLRQAPPLLLPHTTTGSHCYGSTRSVPPPIGVVRSISSDFRPKASLRETAQSQNKSPTSVPVRVAHELLQAGHKYLDVRTCEEFSAGHVPGAINVPYLFKVGTGMSKNTEFVAQVLSHFRKDDEIVVGCQLGKRSMMAATDLVSAGFTGITDIAGGYASWTQTGLPTE